MAVESFALAATGGIPGFIAGGYIGYMMSNMLCEGRDHDADSAMMNIANLAPIPIVAIVGAIYGARFALSLG